MSAHQVGIVGAGQLARMAAEAASALGLSLAVLAESPDDAACPVATEVVLGSPMVLSDLRALASRVEVLTFDHELVDLAAISTLMDEGVAVRPGPDTLEMAVDKSHMRPVLARAGVPVPAYVVVELDPGDRETAGAAIARFASGHGWPLVLKTARGGYDGRGVWTVGDQAEAEAATAPLRGALVVEEMVPLRAELAVMVARSPSGESAAWPAVETTQVGGVCREVLVPGRLPLPVMDQAAELARRVAAIAGAVGVLAVELFWATDGRLLVNEIAARPHNSGHWTMEGAVTSQFENHLRAVLDLPLGSTSPQHDQVASVNVFGGPAGEDPLRLLPRALAVTGAHVHLYGKGPRPGRKLGHVTVCGDEAEVVRERAWAAALALGTPRPEGLVLPAGVA